MLADAALSLASQLPQVFMSGLKIVYLPRRSSGLRQTQLATVDKSHGAEHAARKFAAQHVGQVVEGLCLAQTQSLAQYRTRKR